MWYELKESAEIFHVLSFPIIILLFWGIMNACCLYYIKNVLRITPLFLLCYKDLSKIKL